MLPIGGTDMPVVISLLHAGTGTAVAMAGFVIDNAGLIIAGGSGRRIRRHPHQAHGRCDEPGPSSTSSWAAASDQATATARPRWAGAAVREMSVDDATIQLAYASKIIIGAGYGLAAAQAQHAVRELAALTESRGVDVYYAVHPSAVGCPAT